MMLVLDKEESHVEDNLLADVVVTDGEETDNTGPCTSDLPGELVCAVLLVSAEAEQTTERGNSNNVANDDWVALVLVGPLLGLLGLLLDLLAVSAGLLLELGGLLISLAAEVLCALLGLVSSVVGGLLKFLCSLASVLAGLLLGLLGLALRILERGRGLEVSAVERVERVHGVVVVLNLRDVVGHPALVC
jgi:hypothetical protein